MGENFILSFHFSFSLTVRFLTFLFVTTIIVITLTLNQDQIVIAQQQQQLQFLEDISFDIDGVTFSHHMASVNGIQMHYVIGGKGDPIVLLHGFPQSWYEWRHIMPSLAKNYTVIVPDL